MQTCMSSRGLGWLGIGPRSTRESGTMERSGRELTRDRPVGDAIAVEGTEPDLAIYRNGRRGTGVRRGRGETREVADDERLRVDGLGRKAAGTRRARDT